MQYLVKVQKDLDLILRVCLNHLGLEQLPVTQGRLDEEIVRF